MYFCFLISPYSLSCVFLLFSNFLFTFLSLLSLPIIFNIFQFIFFSYSFLLYLFFLLILFPRRRASACESVHQWHEASTCMHERSTLSSLYCITIYFFLFLVPNAPVNISSLAYNLFFFSSYLFLFYSLFSFYYKPSGIVLKVLIFDVFFFSDFPLIPYLKLFLLFSNFISHSFYLFFLYQPPFYTFFSLYSSLTPHCCIYLFTSFQIVIFVACL